MKVLLTLLVFCFAAFGQSKWEHLVEFGDLNVFTDVSTLARDGTGKQLWLKYVPVNRTRYITVNKLPRAYAHQVSLIRFNCGEKTYVPKRILWYSVKGEALRSTESTKVVDIVPGSLSAELYSLVCQS